MLFSNSSKCLVHIHKKDLTRDIVCNVYSLQQVYQRALVMHESVSEAEPSALDP